MIDTLPTLDQLQGRSRLGDWIQTYTGERFYPLDPVYEDFKIQDIAHALSLICRFGGHCSRFYSVAEHSVRVARAVLDQRGGQLSPWNLGLVYTALMHDSSEAYLGDIPRPIKHLPEFAFYRKIEDDLMTYLSLRYEFAYPPPYEVD